MGSVITVVKDAVSSDCQDYEVKGHREFFLWPSLDVELSNYLDMDVICIQKGGFFMQMRALEGENILNSYDRENGLWGNCL